MDERLASYPVRKIVRLFPAQSTGTVGRSGCQTARRALTHADRCAVPELQLAAALTCVDTERLPTLDIPPLHPETFSCFFPPCLPQNTTQGPVAQHWTAPAVLSSSSSGGRSPEEGTPAVCSFAVGICEAVKRLIRRPRRAELCASRADSALACVLWE